jgi:hypothetical protein
VLPVIADISKKNAVMSLWSVNEKRQTPALAGSAVVDRNYILQPEQTQLCEIAVPDVFGHFE